MSIRVKNDVTTQHPLFASWEKKDKGSEDENEKPVG